MNKLNNEKINLLNHIFMIWDIKKNNWNNSYNKLKEHYIINGDINNFSLYKDISLKNWIVWQKELYSKKELTKEKVKKLENLNIIWNFHINSWFYGYKKAKDYYIEYKNLAIPKRYVTTDNYALGQWISNNRNWKKRILYTLMEVGC